MQTVYFTTTNFIRHEGNMVDLTEYRRRLAAAQGQHDPEPEPEEPVRAASTRSARRRAVRPGMMLDYAASVALIITALSFAVKIL